MLNNTVVADQTIDPNKVDVYSTKQGDVLDLIVYQHYGQCPGHLLCRVFEANIDCLHFDQLPAGLSIKLPQISLSSEIKEEQLWD
jgi:phage tail protein X